MSQGSALRAGARPVTRPVGRTTAGESRLRVVAPPAHIRSRAGLVAVCLVLLTGGLIGLLMLNVSLERGTYQLRAQQVRENQLLAEQQALQEQLETLRAPQHLAQRATSLGMVAAPNVAFLDSDGRVLGVPSPGVAAPRPTPSSTPGTAATAAPKAGTKAVQKTSKKVANGAKTSVN